MSRFPGLNGSQGRQHGRLQRSDLLIPSPLLQVIFAYNCDATSMSPHGCAVDCAISPGISMFSRWASVQPCRTGLTRRNRMRGILPWGLRPWAAFPGPGCPSSSLPLLPFCGSTVLRARRVLEPAPRSGQAVLRSPEFVLGNQPGILCS
jgi:hypothetical protein